MTFIAVIDLLTKYKENRSALRSKQRVFDNKEEYMHTYFEQKHVLGKTHKKAISESRKQAFLLKFRKEKIHEQKVTLIKVGIALILSLALITGVVLLFVLNLF